MCSQAHTLGCTRLSEPQMIQRFLVVKSACFYKSLPTGMLESRQIATDATIALIVRDFAISFNCPALKLICSFQWAFTKPTCIKYLKKKNTHTPWKPPVMFCFSHIVILLPQIPTTHCESHMKAGPELRVHKLFVMNNSLLFCIRSD